MKFLPLNPVPGERIPAAAWVRRHWLWLLAAAILGVLVYAYYSKPAKTTGAGAPSGQGAAQVPRVAVTTMVAKPGDIGIYLTGLGTVTPLRTVAVKSRVDGELMKVAYKEGQIVPKGYLLAVIDPRPYEAQLTQAQGQLIRDQALLQNARLDVKRYRTLTEQDSIAKQIYDTQRSLVRQYEGTVKLDQGNLDNAKVQVIYSRITAPINGRIGLRLVDPGNIVHASDTTGIAVITQLEPITVIFTIPEDHLSPVLDKLKAGGRLPVDAYNREQSKKLATGTLLTMDNQVDVNSGTVRLKAEFPNKDHALFPNQFVNARLLLDTQRGATVVPTAAIQRSPQGAYVYLVNADQTVAVRQVSLGPSEGDNTAIDKGLSPGERVVVEGAERLREGSPVEEAGPANDNSQKGPANGNSKKAPTPGNSQKGK